MSISRESSVRALANPSALAAVLIALGLAAALWPRERHENTLGGPGPSAVADASTIDLDTMTPDEAADRLFRRVSGALVSQDMEQVRQFLPMAIAAFQRVEDISPPQRFQLSYLHRAAGRFSDALITAQDGLKLFPDDLLLLGMASESALSLADTGTAVAYASRFIEGYQRPDARSRVSGADHEWLERLRARAEVLVGRAAASVPTSLTPSAQ